MTTYIVKRPGKTYGPFDRRHVAERVARAASEKYGCTVSVEPIKAAPTPSVNMWPTMRGFRFGDRTRTDVAEHIAERMAK